MKELNTLKEALIATNKSTFSPREILAKNATLGFADKVAVKMWNSMHKVSRGLYSFKDNVNLGCSGDIANNPATSASRTLAVPTNHVAPAKHPATQVNFASCVQSAINDDVYVPAKDDTFVGWGDFSKIKQILSSNLFFPIYISGFSGNGKTIMVEQACAQLKREYIRVQISPETDEDDLIGGFRLINGETIFQKGPIIKAMECGAVLLVDEIDRSSNKIMCLQGVLEGKPIMIKKTGEMIHPASGFTIVATANTKGRGSDDGRYSSSTIIDDAFLERFIVSIEHPHPSQVIEQKIISKHMERYDCKDESIAHRLSVWSEIIRKTFNDEGVDEFIATRRLCHIVKTFSIFRDINIAIAMCISRFDADTQSAFTSLFEKISPTGEVSSQPPAVSPTEVENNSSKAAI